jgi:OHCU decarboxylase
MATECPFLNFDELCNTADRVWWSLEQRDWLEAFQSHPKIGENRAASAVAAEAREWSADEQAGVRDSAAETMQALAQLNRLYEERFGYIFIVCASGKSSEELLAIMRDRLKNSPAKELQIAVAEQAKITRLRLAKLLGGAQ